MKRQLFCSTRLARRRGHRALALTAGLLLAQLPGAAVHALTCDGGSLNVWPPPGEVPRDPVFVLDGTVKWSSELAKIRRGRVYLKSDAGRTGLVEVRRYAGYTTQIVYAPAEPLEPGRLYRLVMRRDVEPRFGRVVELGGWRVRAEPDTERPSFTSPPELILNRGQNIGWGPSTTTRFGFEANEEPVLVLVDLGPDSDYYRGRRQLILTPWQGAVGLYSGPCGRNFTPRTGERYLVSFRLMDAAGNIGGSPAHRLTFVAPEIDHLTRRRP